MDETEENNQPLTCGEKVTISFNITQIVVCFFISFLYIGFGSYYVSTNRYEMYIARNLTGFTLESRCLILSVSTSTDPFCVDQPNAKWCRTQYKTEYNVINYNRTDKQTIPYKEINDVIIGMNPPIVGSNVTCWSENFEDKRVILWLRDVYQNDVTFCLSLGFSLFLFYIIVCALTIIYYYYKNRKSNGSHIRMV